MPLSGKRVTPVVMLLSIVFLLALSFFSGNLEVGGQVSAESTPVLTQEIVDISTLENDTVYVGVYVVDIYSFDYITGEYTLDLYVYFAWIDPEIDAIEWYLMNGYPIERGGEGEFLVRENKTGILKREIYRLRANFNTKIEPTNYPFDSVQLPISIELLPTRFGRISFSWLGNETGISPSFKNVGWDDPVFELHTSTSEYPFENEAPRADMIIEQDRNLFGAVTGTVIPPILFCLVSVTCFLFKMYDEASFGLRIGISTSMLITAVLFDISEQNDIPPVSSITIYSALMLAVTAFLVIVMIVTVVGYVEWMRSQDKNYVDKINKIGFILSMIIPVLLFVTLFLLK